MVIIQQKELRMRSHTICITFASIIALPTFASGNHSCSTKELWPHIEDALAPIAAENNTLGKLWFNLHCNDGRKKQYCTNERVYTIPDLIQPGGIHCGLEESVFQVPFAHNASYYSDLKDNSFCVNKNNYATYFSNRIVLMTAIEQLISTITLRSPTALQSYLKDDIAQTWFSTFQKTPVTKDHFDQYVRFFDTYGVFMYAQSRMGCQKIQRYTVYCVSSLKHCEQTQEQPDTHIFWQSESTIRTGYQHSTSTGTGTTTNGSIDQHVTPGHTLPQFCTHIPSSSGYTCDMITYHLNGQGLLYIHEFARNETVRNRLIRAESAYMFCLALKGWVVDVLTELEQYFATQYQNNEKKRDDTIQNLETVIDLQQQRHHWLHDHFCIDLTIQDQRSFMRRLQKLSQTFTKETWFGQDCAFTFTINNATQEGRCRDHQNDEYRITSQQQKVWYVSEVPLVIDTVTDVNSVFGILRYNATLWNPIFPPHLAYLRRAHLRETMRSENSRFPFFF